MKMKNMFCMLTAMIMILTTAIFSQAAPELAPVVNYSASDGSNPVTIADLSNDIAPGLMIADNSSDNVSMLISRAILTDTDGDGEPDITDGCPNNFFKIEPGVCGCVVADTDSDHDGIPNCFDDCPDDPWKIYPGTCGCGNPDTDFDGDGTPDCIEDPVFEPPIADAGPDQTVDSEAVVTLDGSDSYDPDVAIVSYFWKQTDGPTVALKNANHPKAWFTSPLSESDDILLTFTLAVRDNDGLSTTASVNITVKGIPLQPCKIPPQSVSPANGDTQLSLTPDLMIDKDIDPVTCDSVLKTRWQISDQADFLELVYNRNVFDADLFSHQVPQGVLQPDIMYYWRADIHCSSGCTSEYSTPSAFTTGEAENDANGNGIPDNQELDGETALDGDGQPDNYGNHFKGIATVVGDIYVAIETSGNITSLQSLDNMDQATLEGMPDDMPWGLISFRIETANPGDTVQVTIYFDEQAPDGAVYYKYDPIDGWIDYSEHATFAPDMMSVTIEIQDGGFGDMDGAANGIIVDPGGVGTFGEDNGGKRGSGSDGTCFLDTVSKF